MSVITDLIDENSSCHARIAELEARIVWLECEAQVNAAPVQQASVPDERANFESEYLKANYPRVYSGELSAPPIFGQTGKGEYEDDDMQKCWIMWQARAMLAAAPAAPAADASALADAFLSWKLPNSVRPDGCAMDPTYPHRYGTNLMTWAQAKGMFEYVLSAHRAKGVV